MINKNFHLHQSCKLLGLILYFAILPHNAYGKAFSEASGPFQFNDDRQPTRIGDGVYERDEHPYAGAGLLIVTKAQQNPDDGDTWAVSIDLKNTGQRLGTARISYDAASDCLLFEGTPVRCGVYVPDDSEDVNRFPGTIFFHTRCLKTRDYQVAVEFLGNPLGSAPWDIRPTRFKPKITYSYFGRSIQPELPEDNYVSGNPLPAQAPGKATGSVAVRDNLGCGVPLPDVEISVKNTIGGAAGHAHFAGSQEPGTGKYEALNSGDVLDPAKDYTIERSYKKEVDGKVITVVEVVESYTAIAGITGKTDSNGLFKTRYTAGLFGVEEIIQIEAKRPAISEKDPESSDTAEDSLDIQVPGLVSLPSTGDFHTFVYGGTCAHDPTARWVSADMYPRVISLAALYARDAGTEDYTHILSLNDASTQFGGLLDNQGGEGRNRRCHGSHRQGIDIDVNSVDRKIEKATGKITVGDRMESESSTVIINGQLKNKADWLESLAESVYLEKVVEASIHYRNKNHR